MTTDTETTYVYSIGLGYQDASTESFRGDSFIYGLPSRSVADSLFIKYVEQAKQGAWFNHVFLSRMWVDDEGNDKYQRVCNWYNLEGTIRENLFPEIGAQQ